MRSYQPADWHDLFVASAGAAAALTGLIFVAVSINLAQILADRKLPTRAAETLSILVGLVLLSVFMLVPGQDSTGHRDRRTGRGARDHPADQSAPGCPARQVTHGPGAWCR
jgi:modulator of FtsH protease